MVKKLILKLLKTNYLLRRVWRYQRGNQNPCVEERQKTTMAKKKKGKHEKTFTSKIQDQETGTPIKTPTSNILNIIV